ncbi:hypothetical protein, partial ['Fragaria x ananassa' phyllody phytoplasma]
MTLKKSKSMFTVCILLFFLIQTNLIFSLPNQQTFQRCNAFNYGVSINIMNNDNLPNEALTALEQENIQLKKYLLQLENQVLKEQIKQKSLQNNNTSTKPLKNNFFTKFYYYLHQLLHLTNDNLTLTNSIIDLANIQRKELLNMFVKKLFQSLPNNIIFFIIIFILLIPLIFINYLIKCYLLTYQLSIQRLKKGIVVQFYQYLTTTK